MFGSELITKCVENPKQQGPAVVPFITAGYPDKDNFLELVDALAKAADVIEVGVPFSDPMADGVTIQRSSHAAIESGVTLQWILEQLKTLNTKTPIVLMSYLNPLYVYGYDQLVKDALEAGVDGFIIPDLPIEEGEEIKEVLNQAKLAMIQLVTPATPEKRIKKIAKNSTGFLYAVTVKGVTGGSQGLSKEVVGYLETVKASTNIPVCAGFGVRNRTDVDLLEPHVDGIIVGSALVEAIEQNTSVTDFLKALRA
jgi:tryptophan synthase alpha chain